MNHKRGRSKNARSGCLMCKPHKACGAKHSDKARAMRAWKQEVRLGYEGGKAYRIGGLW